MSGSKGTTAQTPVKRRDSLASKTSTSRGVSQQPSDTEASRLEGRRSRKEHAKDVAANLGLLYGAATAIPAVAAGAVCGICGWTLGPAYAIGHRMCTHEPMRIGGRLEEPMVRGYSLGTKALGGEFIVERSLKRLGGPDYGDGRNAAGERMKLFKAPWRRPDNSLARMKFRRADYWKTKCASQA